MERQALSLVGRSLKEVADRLIRPITATVATADAAWNATGVVLDSDPSGRQVTAVSLLGPLAAGTRVFCLSYPPRGLVILGALNSLFTLKALRLRSTTDVTLTSTGHALQIGPSSGQNLVADSNEIQSRNNGAAGNLGIQMEGGNATFFSNSANTNSLTVNGAFSCNVIAVGRTSITPVANVISSVVVTGLALYPGKTYRAVVTADSSVPGEAGVAGALYEATCNTVTDDGLTVYILRGNNTATGVFYVVAAEDI